MLLPTEAAVSKALQDIAKLPSAQILASLTSHVAPHVSADMHALMARLATVPLASFT